jgi:putative spermidine/putrescine transport system substrate-binding protein
MYLWMNYVVSPSVQAQIAEFFGEAPANVKACDLTTDPNFCDDYHATDEGFWNRVYFWNTPVADCGDDRGDVCKDYNDWTAAWTEIKG